jgi:hypothetical protein
VSIQDLKPNPQLISEFYLEKIYNRLGDTDPSHASLLDTASKPPISSPPRYVVWVNSLWFLSFAISLTYAMLAMMLHQWARRYIRVTQHLRSSPHERARVRAFFSNAIDGLHVPWVIEGMRAMIHLSMFLFFAGLLIYLFNICHVAFAAVVWWVALSTVVYASFTLLPIFWPNSPYYAPLSSILWSLYACICYAVFKVLSFPVFSCFGIRAIDRFRDLKDYYRERFFEDIRKIAKETASQQASVIDVHVLEWIFDALGEDGAWEKFFEAVPGFFSSELVNGLEEHLPNEFRIKFSQALSGFLDRTFLFSSVTESVRSGRLIICLNAAHAALGFDGVLQIFRDILNGRWPELIQSVEIGHSLRRWSNSNDEWYTPDVRRIVAQIVVGVRERDNCWISLVKAEYGIAEHVLRDCIGNGDSVLLSILLHMTRQAFHTRSWTPWILSSLSELTIRDTFPELQHAFCALWNDIVLEAWNEEGPINNPVRILREVRHVYIALHDGTDAALTAFSASTYHFDPVLRQPESYRLCNVVDHRQRLPIYTPIIGSLNIPSLTQLDQSPAASLPYPSSIESDHTPDYSTASQQAEEASVIIEPPSPTDYTPDPSHTRAFTSSLVATNSAHIAQGTSIARPSVPESIETAIISDSDLLVPGGALHDPRQSTPSAAEITATDFGRSDDPKHTNESVKTSQAPVAPSLNFRHPDPVPATTTPSTVADRGDNPDTLQDTIASAILSHPLEGDKQQDTVTPSDSENPSTIKPILRPIPTSVVCDSSPILLSAPSGSMTTAGSAPIQPDHTPHACRSSSSSPTTVSHLAPQVASAFDVQVTSNIGMSNPHDDGHDLNPPIPITVLPHLHQTALPAHDTITHTLPLEDRYSVA